MKKILSILGSLVLTTTTATIVVSCRSNSNSDFQRFMNVVNGTQGDFTSNPPTKKSSAAVIYFGAKDNAASQSFEYALTKHFGSLNDAQKRLSTPKQVTNTTNYSVDIQLQNTNPNQVSFSVTGANLTQDLKDATFVKVTLTFKNSNDKYETVLLDATYQSDIDNGTFLFSNNDSAYLNNLLNNGLLPTQNVNLQGFNILNDDTTGLISSWQNAFATSWIDGLFIGDGGSNADRAIANVEVVTEGKRAGRITEVDSDIPLYGIKSSDVGLRSTGYTYATPQLTFQAFSVNEVSQYWNSDLFKRMTDDYIRPNLIKQIAAQEGVTSPEPDESPIPSDKFQNRVKKANEIINEQIQKAKGPLFLIIKNGQLIAVQNGWNVYNNFPINGIDFSTENSEGDLVNWVNSLGEIFQSATQTRLSSDTGVFKSDTFNFTNWDQDQGASNWDWENHQPKN